MGCWLVLPRGRYSFSARQGLREVGMQDTVPFFAGARTVAGLCPASHPPEELRQLWMRARDRRTALTAMSTGQSRPRSVRTSHGSRLGGSALAGLGRQFWGHRGGLQNKRQPAECPGEGGRAVNAPVLKPETPHGVREFESHPLRQNIAAWRRTSDGGASNWIRIWWGPTGACSNSGARKTGASRAPVAARRHRACDQRRVFLFLRCQFRIRARTVPA